MKMETCEDSIDHATRFLHFPATLSSGKVLARSIVPHVGIQSDGMAELSPKTSIDQWKIENRIIAGNFEGEPFKNFRERQDYDAFDAEGTKNLLKEYLKAGCTVLCSPTYYLGSLLKNPQDFNDFNIDRVLLLGDGVSMARAAVREFMEETGDDTMLPIVAGTIGPSDAYKRCPKKAGLGETSKRDEVAEQFFQSARFLIKAGADLLAWENIPSMLEVKAIVNALDNLSHSIGSFITLHTEDGQNTINGDPLSEVANHIHGIESVFGIGISCKCPAEKLVGALSILEKFAPNKVIISYPHHNGNSDNVAPSTESRCQTHWVGACCTATPEQVKNIIQQTTRQQRSHPLERHRTNNRRRQSCRDSSGHNSISNSRKKSRLV